MEMKGSVCYVSTMDQRRVCEGKKGKFAIDFFVIVWDSQLVNGDVIEKRCMFEVISTAEHTNFKNWSLKVGDEVTVQYDIDCREHKGRWYNSFKAWKVEKEADTAKQEKDCIDSMPTIEQQKAQQMAQILEQPVQKQQAVAQQSAPAQQSVPAQQNDDLPF